MYAKQKHVIDSLIRVRSFLEAHPLGGELSYDGPRERLEQVITRIWGHAGTQISGRALNRGEVRLQAQLMTQIRTRHMRPLVAIARAQVEDGADVRLRVAFRMPKVRIGVTKMIQVCDAMIAMARDFESVLIAEGRPTDFIARFVADRDALLSTQERRAHFTGSHVAAGAGLQVELRRGRLAVGRLDSIIRVAFEDDAPVLAAWRAAKRVHQPARPAVPAPSAQFLAHDELEAGPHLRDGTHLDVHESHGEGDLPDRILGDVGGHLGRLLRPRDPRGGVGAQGAAHPLEFATQLGAPGHEEVRDVHAGTDVRGDRHVGRERVQPLRILWRRLHRQEDRAA